MQKALVIGIDDYSFAPLSGCVNDATSVAQLLEKNGDGSPNFDVRQVNNVGTKAELKRLVNELFSSPVETALFYYSGHGYRNENGGYIVTPDYQKDDEGVAMAELLQIVNKSKATNKIVILDCCNSGVFGSGIFSDNLTEIGEGVTILTASMGHESAVEVNGHGIFTNLLLSALSGAAANINGNITPGSIYSYIDQALDAWEQRPVFKTNTHCFVNIRKVNPSIDLSVLRKITEYFPDIEDVFQLNPSFEFTNSLDYKNEVIDAKNVKIMKDLQKMESVGLVKPIETDHMYFAAMESKGCQLTPLGYHYWQLVKKRRI